MIFYIPAAKKYFTGEQGFSRIGKNIWIALTNNTIWRYFQFATCTFWIGHKDPMIKKTLQILMASGQKKDAPAP